MAQLENLMKSHFVDYASYFILDRAIPELRDGLKPVQRRILHTLFQMDDGRFHKVANVIGETMKFHPHGDASIGDALVVLANKGFFIERQGNFGNPITGHPAAAARYIECRLTDLALETLFFEPLTEFVESYDGRNREPVCLLSKLPVVLMLGTEGIAVGMSTKIMPHNLVELWEAQIGILNGERPELLPDFPQGGLMDVSAYEDGRGKVDVRARIKTVDAKHIVIQEIPFGTTTDSLIASIEAAAQRGRIKVSSIQDYTTDKVEIELTLGRGVTPKEVIPQLYAYTDCSVSVSSNLVVINERKPVHMTVSEILEILTDRLQDQIKQELDYQRAQLVDRHHWLTLEQIFVEKRVYKRIEEAETDEAVRTEVWTGMHEWEAMFVRPMEQDDVKRLLELRIRRISVYDIEKNRQQVEEIVASIAEVDLKLAHITRTTIQYIQALLDKYGDQFPRKTHVTRIEAVDKKSVAQQNIKLSHDPESGFFGSEVRGNQFQMTVSEFDLVLGIASDGTYRVMTPPEKVLFSGKLLYCEVFDPEKGAEFTVVYRDRKKMAFAKRFEISKFIRNREYQLIKDRAGKVDHLLVDGDAGIVELSFVPAKRQRVNSASFDLADLEVTGTTARGVRLAPKPVAKIKLSAGKPKKAKAGKRGAGGGGTGKPQKVATKAPTKPTAASPKKSKAAPKAGKGPTGAKSDVPDKKDVPPRGGQGSLFE